MPSKKVTSKGKLHHLLSGEPHLQRCTLVIQKGGEFFGDIIVELCGLEAPKACEIFSQNINNNEKNRGKQSTYKNCTMKRLTKIGLQTGETNPPAKNVNSTDLDGEIGKVPHGYGMISLCRYSYSFDGSQFFFCLTEDPLELDHLNKKHVAFGKVVGGQMVLQNLVQELEAYIEEDGKYRRCVQKDNRPGGADLLCTNRDIDTVWVVRLKPHFVREKYCISPDEQTFYIIIVCLFLRTFSLSFAHARSLFSFIMFLRAIHRTNMTSALGGVSETACSQICREAVLYYIRSGNEKIGIGKKGMSSLESRRVLESVEHQGIRVGIRLVERLLLREHTVDASPDGIARFIGGTVWSNAFGKVMNSILVESGGKYLLRDQEFKWTQGCIHTSRSGDGLHRPREILAMYPLPPYYNSKQQEGGGFSNRAVDESVQHTYPGSRTPSGGREEATMKEKTQPSTSNGYATYAGGRFTLSRHLRRYRPQNLHLRLRTRVQARGGVFMVSALVMEAWRLFWISDIFSTIQSSKNILLLWKIAAPSASCRFFFSIVFLFCRLYIFFLFSPSSLTKERASILFCQASLDMKMFRFVANKNAQEVLRTTTTAMMKKRFVSLQSHKPCATLPDKIRRGAMQTSFYAHPTYIYAREKMLSTVWVDIGVATLSYYFLIPFFAVAMYFRA
eukprot:gene11307-7839_t